MTTDDIRLGDDVKNGRSGFWGRVLEVQVVDDTIVRVKVRRHLGCRRLEDKPTWWAAESITFWERR